MIVPNDILHYIAESSAFCGYGAWMSIGRQSLERRSFALGRAVRRIILQWEDRPNLPLDLLAALSFLVGLAGLYLVLADTTKSDLTKVIDGAKTETIGEIHALGTQLSRVVNDVHRHTSSLSVAANDPAIKSPPQTEMDALKASPQSNLAGVSPQTPAIAVERLSKSAMAAASNFWGVAMPGNGVDSQKLVQVAISAPELRIEASVRYELRKSFQRFRSSFAQFNAAPSDIRYLLDIKTDFQRVGESTASCLQPFTLLLTYQLQDTDARSAPLANTISEQVCADRAVDGQGMALIEDTALSAAVGKLALETNKFVTTVNR